MGTAIKTVSYAYGNTGWKDLLTSYNGQSITYDTIGNPLSYRGMTLTWANGRQLATLTKSGATSSYSYDINGNRTKKVTNGVTTEYYLNEGTVVAEKKGSELIRYLFDENGNRFGLEWKNVQYYYVFNGQGDVIGITDPRNRLAVSYTYDAWGKLLSTGGDCPALAAANPIRYRGYYYDAESGLYYLNSRYYDPETGRFLNADGLLGANGDILSYNQFAYCSNNPIIYYDHEGYYSLLSTVISSVCSAIKTAMPFLKKQARDKNGFTTAYKVNNGTDFEVDNSKYTEWTVTKKQVEVNEYDDLYSDIITWSTMAAFTAYNPAFTAFDFVLLLSPQNRIPIGTYTQYTVTLYEEPVVVSTPRKYHGYDTADMDTTVYQNYLVETYIMGPGNANLLIKTSSYYYNDERISYYTNKPWARR